MRLDRWLSGRGCGHVERRITEDLVGCRRGFAFTGREMGRHSKIGSTGFARLGLDYKTNSTIEIIMGVRMESGKPVWRLIQHPSEK